MGEFIARYLGVPFEYARHLQKTYYRQFGTTLSGLMQVHKMDPKAFLDYVHDIDLSVVAEHPELAAGHRGASRPQAHLHQRLARATPSGWLASSACCICSTASSISSMPAYVPKPVPACYDQFLQGARCRCRYVGHVRGHAAQPGGAARAGHDHRAGALAFNYDHPVQKTIRAGLSHPRTCTI